MEKVIDIEERIPSMREKRRRKTNRKFIFIVTIFAARSSRDSLFSITVSVKLIKLLLMGQAYTMTTFI